MLTLLTQQETVSIINSIVKQSEAEAVFVNLNSSESALSRYSENQITQNINKTSFNLSITSYFGQRSARVSTTEFDPESITQTLRRSETLARVAPEDPEWVQLLEPQIYDNRIPAYDRFTVELSPLERGEKVKQVCYLCQQAGVEGSGTLSNSATVQAVGNSLGLNGYYCTTEANFSVTARVNTGSSWSSHSAWGIEHLPLEQTTETVIKRALDSRNPQEIKPGVYPVIFEAAAFAELLSWVIWNLDARAADEGRSFMSRINEQGQPTGNCLGEALFSPIIQVSRDPAHPLLQSGTFFEDGLSNTFLNIIKDGIPQALSYSRYWAQQQGKQATGAMFPMVMKGSEQSLSDIISQTEQGILVSRAWYVRYVNPRTLEVTGMTRDGTFWIENGKIAYPIKNLRFNQCLPEMLQNVDRIAAVQRFGSRVVPGVRVTRFNFSSVTDSV